MPIFSQRRLQNMLDDLRPLLKGNSKVNDIVGRLRNKRPGQALGAEMELALLWGINQVADLEIEPKLQNGAAPEAYSRNLFEKPAYIEVTTISEGSLSGEKNMQRATQKIISYANTIKKKSGNYLYLTFHNKSCFKGNKFYRKLCVEHDFELDDLIKLLIKTWLENPEYENLNDLVLQHEKIKVTIKKTKYKQRNGSNFFSSISPLAYDIAHNPLYSCLKEKYNQLSSVPTGKIKVVFLVDAGSTILKNIGEPNIRGWHFTGEEIIKYFLKKFSIDVVYVFTPKRTREMFGNDKLAWQVSYYINESYGKPIFFFDKMLRFLPIFNKEKAHCVNKIETMMRHIPKPRFEGYQARSLQKQGFFEPTKNKWYLSSCMHSYKDQITMKISARILHEFLAGNVSHEIFLQKTSSSKDNFFKLWLDEGFMIRDISFEDGGIDKDDDYATFTFEKNPSIAPLE